MNCHRYKEEKAKVVKISENVSNFKVGQSFFCLLFFCLFFFFVGEIWQQSKKKYRAVRFMREGCIEGQMITK